MNEYTATYSPDDNKLRLYAVSRLDSETYARVKAAGFKWAPKQELFVAPMWTPSREDLLLELAGEIEDEDKSLTERAEERAERMEQYSENRAEDAERAHKAVSAIADNIPFGQPILVGHHSEKHARRDAAKIENGMRRAVKMWEQSKYWTDRAAGALRHAKYKELPSVRARRIKTIEADQRKRQRSLDDAQDRLNNWRHVAGMEDAEKRNKVALHVANVGGGLYFQFPLDKYPRKEGASKYEGDMCLWSAMDGGIIDGAQAAALAIPRYENCLPYYQRWIAHYNNRLAYERAMLAESGGTATDKTGPEVGGAVRCWASPGYGNGWSYIRKVNKVSVTIANWSNNYADKSGRVYTQTMRLDQCKAVMTRAEVEAAHAAGKIQEAEGAQGFFLMESREQWEVKQQPTPTPEPTAEKFQAMKETLKAGVQVVSAPQLFPTPPELARRMVQEANIRVGMTVLEPSAGTGNICAAILEGSNPSSLFAVEVNHRLCELLSQKITPPADAAEGICKNVLQGDFLECNGNLGLFDRVLMNPPFANADDIKHITHAMHFLKPGGRLVAICANGPRQNEKLRPMIEEAGGTWEPLPAGTFETSGTGVNTALLIYDAPEIKDTLF